MIRQLILALIHCESNYFTMTINGLLSLLELWMGINPII